jgi:hypothetical protein
MGIRFKAPGLALLAAAMSALAAGGASAETGGHFVLGAEHTTILGTETSSHRIHFGRSGAPAEQLSSCEQSAYAGTVTTTTVTQVTITPSWGPCLTTGSPATKYDIDENGCGLQLTVGKGPHHTSEVVCPSGSSIAITHVNCTTRIPPQTFNGLAYKDVEEEGVHSVTLESTVQSITAHNEAGICVLLGTTRLLELTGSITLRAFDTGQTRVSITATG